MDNTMPHYKVVKNSLANILKDEADKIIIHKAVAAVHRVVIHALQFMKLYLLSCSKLPKIDDHFVMCCMRVVRESKLNGNTKNQEEYQKLVVFFNDHYKSTMSGDDSVVMAMKNITQILGYAATGIVTEYETNIKQHFVDYVEHFINIACAKKEKWKDMNNNAKNEFVLHLRSYKSTILEGKNERLPEELLSHVEYILPPRDQTSGKHVNYELAKNPQCFLPCMIYMMQFVESKGEKMMNAFPCRTDIVPKYIRFDTSSLIELLLKDADRRGETQRYYSLHVRQEQAFLWGLYFKTDAHCFGRGNKSYQFGHMIETDGIGCSIILVLKEVADLKYKPKQKLGHDKELYLDDINEITRTRLLKKKMVAIDPNKSDLIYCTADETDGKCTKFRYTQNQRNKESKKNVYKKQRLKMKTDEVIAIEMALSAFNHKTLDVDKYKAYLTAKNGANSKLFAFYENEVYRKMKWNTYINMSRSEDMMINRFKARFGAPDEVVVAFGDWEQKHQMKWKEPTKGKGFRKLFRKHGYEVFLVDEFRTSCMCYACGDENARCDKFKMVNNNNPRSKTERPQILCHGLLKCKTCSRAWNRDTNASLNIGRAGKQMLETQERPRYLSRSLARKTVDDISIMDIKPPKRRKLTSVHVEACTTRERLLGGSELGIGCLFPYLS